LLKNAVEIAIVMMS